jgi:hypothetical protein
MLLNCFEYRCSTFWRWAGMLVPTFRSPRYIAATSSRGLRKDMGTSKSMILVPLFDLKSLKRFCREPVRDFRSAAPRILSNRGVRIALQEPHVGTATLSPQ